MFEADKLRREFLSALAVDESKGLFLLDPDALGFGVTVSPLAGNDPAVGEKLNTLLNLSYPVGSLLQVTLFKSPDVEAQLDHYSALRQTNDPLLKAITEQRVDFLRQATARPIDRVSGVRLHDTRIIISVRVPIGRPDPRPEDIEKVSELRDAFLQVIRTVGLQSRPLTAPDYLRFMNTVLNTRPGASWRDATRERYDDTRLLCDQILDADCAIDIRANGVVLGESTHVRLLHPKQYPEFVDFGVAMRYLGNWMTGDRGIRETAIITANVLFIDHQARAGKLATDLTLVTNQLNGPVARYVSSFKNKKASLDIATKAVDNGDRLVRCYIGMAVYADSESAATAAAANAKTYFSELGFRLLEDRFFCGPLFFQLLPFAGDAALASSLSRYRTVPSRVAVSLLPLMGAWQGTGTPMLTLVSRDGQLMPVCPYDSNTGYNICVAAKTGSGKSFLVNELISNFRARSGRVRVIDAGGSYRNLCESLGGEYVQFTQDSAINLNPFSFVNDFKEDADILLGVLKTMAAPTQPMSDLQSAELSRVVGQLWEEKRSASTIDDVAERLRAETHDPRIVDLGRQLYPFTSHGEYGRFMTGDRTLDTSNPFIVFELQELAGRAHLLRVVLQQVMNLIGHELYLTDRATPKLVVIDEAWESLAKSDARAFIVGTYRKSRKYNGSICTITQSVNDYFSNEGALAIVENSPNMYLLSQKADSIAVVEREQRLPIGEAAYDLMRSVRTVPGEYSEIFAITEYGMGIGRLVVSDFNKLLYSTKPDEVQAIRNLQKRGLGVEDAIRVLLDLRRNAA